MQIILTFIMAIALFLPAQASAENELFIRLSLIQGDVQVSGRDLEDWTGAAINTPLAEGDRLWVADDGRAELQLQGGFFIRLGERSSLDIVSLENGSIQFYMDRGHAYVNNLRGGIKTVQLDTPFSSVRSYDNSIMTLDVSEDGRTEVSVLKGYVYAETRAGATRVNAGNTLTIGEGVSAELSPIGQLDEWETWNMDRDRQVLSWGESSRYLPDELHEYSSDLDTTGSWVFAADYGWSWRPAVTVPDWSPYTVGRWVWSRGNYVWISYEPWGWVPYHYGRWAFVARFGWCWVPPLRGYVSWGPGWVGWIITPTVFAWVPLAPGEIYYGYGHYGPGSVNLVNVNINTVVVNRNYKNLHVRNSVTVVDRDDFTKGHWRPRQVREDRENPFLERKQKKEAFLPPHERPGKQILLPAPTLMREVQPPPERRERKEPVHEERREQPSRERKETREQQVPAPPASVMTPSRQQERRMSAPPAPSAPTERRQPPERVQRTRPEDIKQQRKLMKEKDTSVFSPGRPTELPVTKRTEPKVIMRKQQAPQQVSPPAQERQQREQKEQREQREQREQKERKEKQEKQDRPEQRRLIR